jgi:hypothetical protein
MGKKSKKKAAAVEAAPLTKKERKALQEREARLAAELAEREKAARKARKKGKGGKGKKAAKVKPTPPPVAEVPAQIADAKAERARKRAEKAAAKGEERVDGPLVAPVYVEGLKPAKKSKARENLDEALAQHDAAVAEKATPEARDETDAQIKARLQNKRAERAGLDPDSVDRDDEAAVRAYNEEAVKHGLVLLTSNAERERMAKRDDRKKAAGKKAIETPDATSEAQVAEEVQTEAGREFAVGTASAADAAEDFAQPSEAPKTFEENVNGLGQYKVARPSDGKVVGYTRWTTYIDCLEDKTALEKWKARILLEGVAALESEDYARDESVIVRVNDLVHRRDVAIAKARKADRKGKLGVGELATYVDGAWADFKKALDRLADEVFEVGGGREKAQKGTDIHALCDLAEREGIAAVGDLLNEGEITPADLADVEAYLDAIRRLGAKPVLAEQVVVNDDLKVGGRLDRVYMVKLPGEQRGRKRVVDLKTGRVDYGTGKIAQQIEGYAGSVAYDPDTHERTPLGVDRTLGLLIHLPAGSGKATVHRVDLSLGRKGNKLAGEVRAWRNEGKRAIDLKADVLEEIAQAVENGGE